MVSLKLILAGAPGPGRPSSPAGDAPRLGVGRTPTVPATPARVARAYAPRAKRAEGGQGRCCLHDPGQRVPWRNSKAEKEGQLNPYSEAGTGRPHARTRGGRAATNRFEPAGGLASGPKHTTTLTAMHTAAHGTRGTVRYAVSGNRFINILRLETPNAKRGQNRK